MAPIIFWKRAWSTFLKVLNATITALWDYWRDTASGQVDPTGVMGAAPGLGNITTDVEERFA